MVWAHGCPSNTGFIVFVCAESTETGNGPAPKIMKLDEESMAGQTGNFRRLFDIVQDTFQQIGLSSVSGRL